jgi:hypothetical protein
MVLDMFGLEGIDFGFVITIFRIAATFLMYALVAWLFWQLQQWKYDVMIVKQYENGVRIKNDRGRVFKTKKGAEGFKLLFHKKLDVPKDILKYAYVKSNNVILGLLYGVQSLTIYLDDNDNPHPIKMFSPTDEGFAMAGVPMQNRLWRANRVEQINKDYEEKKSMLLQMLPAASMGLVLVGFIIITILFADHFEHFLSVMESLIATANACASPTLK